MTAGPAPNEPRGRLVALAYWVAVAATVAGVTHVATILVLPYHSPDDAYARLARLAKGTPMATVNGLGPGALIPDQDPALASAFCLYDLRNGPVQVGLDVTGADVAIVSVYGRHGKVLYGLTNRSAAQNHLTVTLLTTEQAASRPKGEEMTAAAKVQVETDEPRGIVLAQALSTSPSAARQAEAEASRLTCSPEPIRPKGGVAVR